MSLKINNYPITSFTKGRRRPVRFGIIHYASAKYYYPSDPYNIDKILEMFKIDGKKNSYSCHYIIDRNGNIYRLVELQDTAWAVGRSVIDFGEYITNLNPDSVNVELVGMASDKFDNRQYESLAKLAICIEDEVKNQELGDIEHWIGHDFCAHEVAVRLGIRPRNKIKVDPGKLFWWPRFYEDKCGLRLQDKIKANIGREVKEETLGNLTSGQCLSLFFKKLRGK